VQWILAGDSGGAGLLAILLVAKLIATSLSLGSGSSGGIFSPSLFMGATLGGAFASVANSTGLVGRLSVPAFAMVGMGAMVGGATGAAMTAVVMIFEMTLSYDIIMPMIVAVAASMGVRRLLSRETIYTLKLARRGQDIPKVRHANMFLVRRARDLMDRDVLVLDGKTNLGEFLRTHDQSDRAHRVVVTDKGRLVGVLGIDVGVRRGLVPDLSSVTVGDVAEPNFVIVRENAVALDVINRMWRKGATMAVVTRGRGVPHAQDVAGLITKDRVADSVADSVKLYQSD
ncbi:MAG: chloride channel protein, partial [Caulobacteraceae bacterium]